MSDTPDPTVPPAPDSPVPPAPTVPAMTPSGLAPGSPLPPPVPGAAAVPRQKARSGVIIAVVVGIVAGGGAIAALLNAAGNEGGNDEPTPITIEETAPTAPAVPGAGTVPTPVTLPGPSVAPPVSTNPDIPTTEPPATEAPATEPPATAAPATEPVLQPPSTVETPADTTEPGIQPPPTTPSDTAAPPATDAPPPAAGTVPMAGGVVVAVPEGWEVVSESETYVVVTSGTTTIFLNLISDATSASDELFAYKDLVAQDVQSAEFTDIEPTQLFSPMVVDSAMFAYRGFVGQGQSGSTPVAGTVYGELRVDGLAIITDMMYVPGDDGAPSVSDSAGISEFVNGFVYG